MIYDNNEIYRQISNEQTLLDFSATKLHVDRPYMHTQLVNYSADGIKQEINKGYGAVNEVASLIESAFN